MLMLAHGALVLTLGGALCVAEGTSLNPRPSEPEPETFQATRTELENYLSACADLGHFSGSVLVARAGEVLLSRGYGYTDLSRTEANSPQTVYRVASITKQFTAMAIMILQQQGRLHVADRIADHLPGAPASWNDITIRQLLSHTSGIPDYESDLGLGSPEYDEFMSRPGAAERILAAAFDKPLRFAPGTAFEYSNTGYVVLGYVVEQASGLSLEEFLGREIFEPLGMADTAHDRNGLQVAHRAAGHELAGEFAFAKFLGGYSFPADFSPAPPMAMTPPQGDAGVITTTLDLLRWDQALNSTALIPHSALEEMFTPVLEGYGYGWNISGGPGRRQIHHTGVLPGFVSRISRFPDEHFTIILLGNTDVSVDRLVADLASIMRGEPVTTPVRRVIVDLKPEEYLPLIGTYVDGQGRVLEVTHDGDMVAVGLEGSFVAGLLAESPMQFFCIMFNGPVRFEADESGAITQIVLNVKGQEWRASRQAVPLPPESTKVP